MREKDPPAVKRGRGQPRKWESDTAKKRAYRAGYRKGATGWGMDGRKKGTSQP